MHILQNNSVITSVILSTFLVCCTQPLKLSDVQNEDLNKYFVLKKPNGGGITNEIRSVKGDKISAFIEKHQLRFDYISFRALMNVISYKVADTGLIYERYRTQISSEEFSKHFLQLTSAPVQSPEKITFTKDELMLVGSRFFYADRVNPDSTIGYHICVGINGQHLIKPSRDLVPLQAFAIEAIFYYIDRDKSLEKNFNSYIQQSIKEEKQTYIDKKTYLKNVRDKCFELMEKDKELERILLKYYKVNADNLGFGIQ